jgi:hypothetical protein
MTFNRCKTLHTLLVTLALVLGHTPAPAAVTLTRLDGSSHIGELRTWEDDHVTLITSQGEERFATDGLLSLRWATEQSSTSTRPPLIELADGTILPVKQFKVAGSRATVELAPTSSAGRRELSFPVRLVNVVQLQPLEGPVAEQWQEIRDQDLASDLLVVLKRRGKSVDYADGVLGDITTDKIEFSLDGESMPVDRAKVAGLIYYRADDQAPVDTRCTLYGQGGLRANAAHVQLSDQLVQITTTEGVEFDWPLDEIYFADFSAGKIAYLSDLEQVTARWTPLVSLPAEASLAAEYGQPRRDQSAYAGPLTLVVREDDSSTSTGRIQSFNRGLAIRSHTEMTFRLPSGFRKFVALAGIEPATSSTGNVKLRIYGDERLLYEEEVAGDRPPLSIELEIANVKRLKLEVDFGNNLDTGDWLNLCDARLVK